MKYYEKRVVGDYYRKIVMRFLEIVGLIALNGTAVFFFFTDNVVFKIISTTFVVAELAVIFLLYFYLSTGKTRSKSKKVTITLQPDVYDFVKGINETMSKKH